MQGVRSPRLRILDPIELELAAKQAQAITHSSGRVVEVFAKDEHARGVHGVPLQLRDSQLAGNQDHELTRERFGPENIHYLALITRESLRT